MRVSEILALLPGCEALLREYGLSCVNCQMNDYETLAEGCLSHGFSDEDIAQLVVELNEMLESQPGRPQTLDVTKEAATMLLEIIRGQGKEAAVLEVVVDERGGFSMDVLDEAPDGSLIFAHREVPSVRVAASALTLSRVGGATIDHRDGRFKLDLPEDKNAKGCACENGGACGCK